MGTAARRQLDQARTSGADPEPDVSYSDVTRNGSPGAARGRSAEAPRGWFESRAPSSWTDLQYSLCSNFFPGDLLGGVFLSE